eukprot:CAMPEP_0117571696 /NCGR_PEP_ID=MMETSP0784-20121206/59906_1 /TAXON_ID=39447 /ORGANISM="" /LENGTH=209 /DNA_ID=CAMNT_0005369907 /DNA_START=21 /DNA_END=650 /DNA_ORIENTATION=+
MAFVKAGQLDLAACLGAAQVPPGGARLSGGSVASAPGNPVSRPGLWVHGGTPVTSGHNSGPEFAVGLGLVASFAALLNRRHQWSALKATGTRIPIRRAMLEGIVGRLVVRQTFNNTHVALCDSHGLALWCTTEKHFEKKLPNSQCAVESAIFAAKRLGINKIVVRLKGNNPHSMRAALTVIRKSGMGVVAYFVESNLPYGGNRAPGVRR